MTLDLFAVRSILFLPASNPRAIAKAREAGADLVVLDLEDAVKPDDKVLARAAAVDATRQPWPMPVAIRLNHARTAWYDEDVEAVRHSRADALVVPRASPAPHPATQATARGAGAVVLGWTHDES
jgi:citrate lyase subunit beta/citryl-CoA lyase